MSDNFIIQGSVLIKYVGHASDVAIPDSITNISARAFYCRADLTGIAIPDSVTGIGDGAFKGCSGLRSITIPDDVFIIGHNAFEDCSGLTGIVLPSPMALINEYVFLGCSGLESMTIPDRVTMIGYGAFKDCSGLKSIVIPAATTWIGDSAFHGDTRLTDVYYGGTREQWDKVTIHGHNDPLRMAKIHFGGAGSRPAGARADSVKIQLIDGEEYVRLDDLGPVAELIRAAMPARG